MGFRRNIQEKIWKIILTGLCMCFAVCISVQASSVSKYVSVSLPMKKTVTQKETGYEFNEKTGHATWTYYRYKVVIPGEGLLKVVLGKGSSRVSGLSLSMYSSADSEDILDDWFFSGKKKQTVLIPVSRGVCYFSGAAKSKMRFTFTAVKPGSNYCAQRAVSLKRGVKAKICQTPGYDYSRWYKIKLTRKQKISFWSDQGNFVLLTDSHKIPIEVESSGSKSSKYTSVNAVPAGTYYLCMRSGGPDEILYSNRYYYTTIYWK